MIWSFVLAGIGVTGLLLAGSRLKIGWMINFLAQILWVAYGLYTRQWGFIISAFAYGYVYARNWWKWYMEEAAEEMQ
jgi:hypothetical protein